MSYLRTYIKLVIYNIFYTFFTVNDIAVSDGTKGCDRSAHIFKCIIKNAPKVRP